MAGGLVVGEPRHVARHLTVVVKVERMGKARLVVSCAVPLGVGKGSADSEMSCERRLKGGAEARPGVVRVVDFRRARLHEFLERSRLPIVKRLSEQAIDEDLETCSRLR